MATQDRNLRPAPPIKPGRTPLQQDADTIAQRGAVTYGTVTISRFNGVVWLTPRPRVQGPVMTIRRVTSEQLSADPIAQGCALRLLQAWGIQTGDVLLTVHEGLCTSMVGSDGIPEDVRQAVKAEHPDLFRQL